jgi:hypothetical protein
VGQTVNPVPGTSPGCGSPERRLRGNAQIARGLVVPTTDSREKAMAPTETQLQELLDKQSITEAIYRYARCMDRLDREAGHSVFWPEATADYGEQLFQGTCYEFIEMCMEAHPNFASHSHQLSNVLIAVDGTTATSETYGDVTLRRIDDGQCIDLRNLGRYIDRWEKRGEEWRIIARIYLHDFDQSGPSGGDFATTGRRDRLDASYFPAG